MASLIAAIALPLAAQKVDPATLPGRDSHQGIVIGCDPYQDEARAKERMGKDNPLKVGVLPVDVYIHNTNKWPLAVTLDSIRLEIEIPGEHRDQLDPVNPEDLATEILHPRAPNVSTPRVPLPFPRAGRGKKWEELHDKLESLSLEQGVVAPGATVHGFVYFDVSHRFDVIRYARLLVPDLKFLGNTQPVMFFEVSLAPPASH